MTFNASQWYTVNDLVRAGIRDDQALQLLIARGVIETQCDGYRGTYLGKSLLLAIDAGKLTVGEPIESSGKRLAARPTTATHRPAATRSAARKSAIPQQILPPIESAKARPKPSLRSRYETMRTAWRDVVDSHMESCGGDRARAVIRANREVPGLAGRVDALCNELRQQAANQIKPSPKPKGSAHDRLKAWFASGKCGACRLA